MSTKHKSKFYLLIFVLTAIVLGWGVWNNYRPRIILASCYDIADRSLNLQKRSSLFEETELTYQETLQGCLRDAGLQ